MGSVAQTIDCPQCGAPLTPSAGEATCQFCGTVSVIHEVAAKKPPFQPVSLGSPIWLHAWDGVLKWLWPRSQAEIVVLPFADPHEDARRPACLSTTLADRIAVATQLHVSSMVGVRHDGGAVLHRFRGRLASHDAVQRWVQGFTPSPVAVIWGEWGADDSSVQLRARAPALGDPAVFLETCVPAAAATDTLLDWLVARTSTTRVAPPSWYAPPPASLVEPYHSSVEGIIDFVLAKIGLLSALRPSMRTRYLEGAYDLARASDAPPQCRLFPLTLTLLAGRTMDALDDAHREQALDRARAATAPGELLTWMSPHLLRELGAADEAEARVMSLRAEPDLSGPYRAWLDSLAQAKA